MGGRTENFFRRGINDSPAVLVLNKSIQLPVIFLVKLRIKRFRPVIVDLELTRAIAGQVSIPVIASGGAGTMEHFHEAFTVGGADAALAASLFHFKEMEIRDLKLFLSKKGIPVRI